MEENALVEEECFVDVAEENGNFQRVAMTDTRDMCRKLIEEAIESALNDSDEMEMAFLKGHLSPRETSPPRGENDITCVEMCGVETECELCRLPRASYDEEERKGGIGCACCERQCKLKYLLFDCIGECSLFIKNDVEKAVKLFKHVRGDLKVALREVNDRLSRIELSEMDMK